MNLIISPANTLSRISVHYRFYFASDFMDIYRESLTPTPYTDYKSIYPPFAHLLMKCIGLVFTSWGAYALFHIGVLVLSLIYLGKLIDQKPLVKILLILCIVFSWPFLFQLERGNLVTWAFFFTVLFFYYYKSGKEKSIKVSKELSYIFLAMATAIKIYPIVFILFLVIDKNFLGTVKTVIYSIVLLTLPILFFKGGFSNLPLLLSNLTELTSNQYITYAKVTITSLFQMFAQWFSDCSTDSFRTVTSIALIVSIVYFFIGCFAAVFLKQKYKTLGLLTSLIILAPQMNFMYCLVFMSPALVGFLNDKNKTKKDILIFICYVIIFFSFPIPIYIRYTIDYEIWSFTLINTIFQIVALLTISMVYIIEGYINAFKLVREKKFGIKIKNMIMFKHDSSDLDFSNGIMGIDDAEISKKNFIGDESM